MSVKATIPRAKVRADSIMIAARSLPATAANTAKPEFGASASLPTESLPSGDDMAANLRTWGGKRKSENWKPEPERALRA